MIGNLKAIFGCIFDAYITMLKVLLPRTEFDSSIAVDEFALIFATLRTVAESFIA
ncbi:hypothetical protein [Bartonella gliris]|uniref:hypothetical protein n=1 Tax=Bartonella gliris TaxID=3004109 RepID=UPI00295EAA5F|nr:hypothetical protein [Bartonella gliris]